MKKKSLCATHLPKTLRGRRIYYFLPSLQITSQVIETVVLASESERMTWLRTLSAALYIDRVFESEIAPKDLVIRDLLGTGSFGEVYRAEYKGAVVAVKVIQGIDETVTTEFAQEAGVLSSLDHPNVLKFVGVCVLDKRRKSMLRSTGMGALLDSEVGGGSLALVVEYCENDTLSSLLYKR